MSERPQENVELLRDMIDRWNRGETILSAFHPDVEWLPLRVATEEKALQAIGQGG
jgi:hypothetical protein